MFQIPRNRDVVQHVAWYYRIGEWRGRHVFIKWCLKCIWFWSDTMCTYYFIILNSFTTRVNVNSLHGLTNNPICPSVLVVCLNDIDTSRRDEAQTVYSCSSRMLKPSEQTSCNLPVLETTTTSIKHALFSAVLLPRLKIRVLPTSSSKNLLSALNHECIIRDVSVQSNDSDYYTLPVFYWSISVTWMQFSEIEEPEWGAVRIVHRVKSSKEREMCNR